MNRRYEILSDAKFAARIARQVQKRLGCECDLVTLRIVGNDLEVKGGGCCDAAAAIEVLFFVMEALGHEMVENSLSVVTEGGPMGRPN